MPGTDMRTTLILSTILWGPGCIASNVVAVDDRMVVASPVGNLTWEPGTKADLSGLFESVEILGDSASALWKVYYYFSVDGTYSGAALVNGIEGLRFQVLSGSWAYIDGMLDLQDGNDALQTSVSGHFLKLESRAGSVVFRLVMEL